MGLETGTYINDLVETNPLGSDSRAEGDNHLRLIKAVIKATFPGMAGAAWRVQPKSAGYTAVLNDNMTVIVGTATLTLALTAAATLGNGWCILVIADGATITVDPNGAETINGVTTLSVPDDEFVLLYCTGSTFYGIRGSVNGLADGAVTSAKLAATLISGLTEDTAPDAAADFVMTHDNSASALRKVALSKVGGVGKQTAWIPAGAMTPRTTNGAQYLTTQLGTNGTIIQALAFDSATAEYAQFQIRMPKSWNESTVTFTPVWTANSTSTNGVAWVLRAKALGNDETIDAAWGSDVTVTDANTATAYQAHIASESGAVTIANASESEWVVFEVYRDVANGSDTLAVDALLLGLTINYTTDAANDA